MSRHDYRAANGRYAKRPAELRESSATTGELLTEVGVGALSAPADGSTPGRALIEIINPGWGSSGYYSEEMLKRDAPKAFPKGTHMYLDHPTESEEIERPERSVKDLAAQFTEDARWDPARGAAVAEATLFDGHRDELAAKKEAIGVSIRARGASEHGEAEGKHGTIITELTEGISVDFVTKAGRGGKIGELLESARAEIEEAAEHLEVDEATSALIEAEIVFNGLLERDVPVPERISLAKKGQAIPVRNSDGEVVNGRFPMANCGDVSNAAQSVGRAGMPTAEIKSFIKRVASKLSCPTPFESGAESDGRKKEEAMSDVDVDKRLSALEESNRQQGEQISTLTEERDKEKDRAERAEDALLAAGAAAIVAEALTGKQEGEDGYDPIIAKLPDRAIERAKKSALSGEVPLTEDGKPDKEKLIERAQKAAKEEHDYLAGASGNGTVVGMGTHPTKGLEESGDSGESGDDNSDDELASVFGELGLSESAAKVAAKGR